MWMCVLFRPGSVDNGSLPTRTTVVLLACLITHTMQIPDIIYHLTWEGINCVRKTLNQVDQKLINARFFGIGPGMFGLVQGWIDASVAENSAHCSPHVILISLSILSFRRLDNRL